MTDSKTRQVFFWAAIGAELKQYHVNLKTAELTVTDRSARAPASVQYAWQHASKPYLYVGSSNRGPDMSLTESKTAHAGKDIHSLDAFSIDPASGALTPHGAPVTLPHRPIHITIDVASEHVLAAYGKQAMVTVHRIRPDATLGEQVEQPDGLDTGILPHQVRVTSSNDRVILVCRGHDPAGTEPEHPGALKVFHYKQGVLSNEASIAPNHGYGFGPRHLDFHPAKPWVYVSLERQHQVCMFTLDQSGISAAPLFSAGTLAEPDNRRPGQMAGTVRVHPTGRFVYAVERASDTKQVDNRKVFVGGENAVIVYAVNDRTGELTLIQRIKTSGMHVRTFAIDPTGSVLIAANKSPVPVLEKGKVTVVPASLDAFRIGQDGRLELAHNYPVDVGEHSIFWSGVVAL